MGEVIILNKVFPEWKVHSAFISDSLTSALALDAKLSSHPIEVACPDANMINQIFDALSYNKAASGAPPLLFHTSPTSPLLPCPASLRSGEECKS